MQPVAYSVGTQISIIIRIKLQGIKHSEKKHEFLVLNYLNG